MSTFNSLREAAIYAGVSHITMRIWAKDYGIGEINGGKWRINKDRLDRLIAAKQGYEDAIDALRQA